jgi:2-C-methyl-D-erythritol 4-phosphate cytidylyltransferase
MNQTSWGIIIASGASEQITEGVEAAFLGVGLKPVIAYSLMAFEHCPDIEKIIVVAKKERQDTVRALAQRFGCTKLGAILASGATREACLQSAVDLFEEEVVSVAIHEASRPMISSELISKMIASARRGGCATAATRLAEPIQMTIGQAMIAQPPADGVPWVTHTPCAFQREVLEKGLAALKKKKTRLVEETELARLVKAEVRLVEVPPPVLKIRTASDLAIAAALLR